MLSWIEKGWFPPIPEVNNKRSLIHVDDLVKAILKVADNNNNTNGEIFIAAEEKTYTSREIFEAMCILHGKGVPKWSVPKFLFDFLALISPKFRHEFKKIFNQVYQFWYEIRQKLFKNSRIYPKLKVKSPKTSNFRQIHYLSLIHI